MVDHSKGADHLIGAIAQFERKMMLELQREGIPFLSVRSPILNAGLLALSLASRGETTGVGLNVIDR